MAHAMPVDPMSSIFSVPQAKEKKRHLGDAQDFQILW
jgi:hypothetical protein